MQAVVARAFTPPVVVPRPKLLGVSSRALSEDESARVVVQLRRIVHAAGGQSQAARQLKMAQQTISKSLAPGASIGVNLARVIAKHLNITFDELVGAVTATEGQQLAPKDQVRASALYRSASPAVRARFDDLAPYTRTPDGEVARDVLWFTRRLVNLIDDEREGMLEGPPGAEPEPEPVSQPAPEVRRPRRPKPRHA